MHAQIAAEAGEFDAAGVSEAAAAKMVLRHPHVFGEVEVSDAEEVLRNWERQKATEAAAAGAGGPGAVLHRVPASLPALAWALGLQKRAARVGFEGPPGEVPAGSIGERAQALAASDAESEFEELGDLLWALVSLARQRRLNPEDALRAAGRRFMARFEELERRAGERGLDLRELTPAQLAELWPERI
jgi:MazG family protein